MLLPAVGLGEEQRRFSRAPYGISSFCRPHAYARSLLASGSVSADAGGIDKDRFKLEQHEEDAC
jgi:hypothetical protein